LLQSRLRLGVRRVKHKHPLKGAPSLVRPLRLHEGHGQVELGRRVSRLQAGRFLQ
jgi:hypothetical protein